MESGSADATRPEPRVPPWLLVQADLDEEMPGSPTRALLEWWQALQYRDAGAVVRLTANKTVEEVGAGNLRELARSRGSNFLGLSIVDTRRRTGTASDRVAVRALLLNFDVDDNGAATDKAGGTPTTFTLIRERGRWRLLDLAGYVQSLIGDLDPKA